MNSFTGDSRPRRVFLISPVFHGYWQAIEGALKRHGHTVRTLRYDALTGTVAKARHKLRVEAADRLGRDGHALWADETTQRAARAVLSSRPDVVVVIKGDVLGDAFWDAVDAVGARRVTWFYDELRRMQVGTARLARCGAVATYSAHDAHDLTERGVSARYLPLAYDASLSFSPVPVPEVTFVGARYGRREPLLTALRRAGVPVRAYGRDWSHHPWDRVRTWSWSRPAVPGGRDLRRSDAYGVMAGSTATLNLHGDQDGFTMRTFEASGVGGLQLIDRDDVAGLYEPGREVLVFHSPEELVDLCARAATDTVWAQGIREAGRRRTLAEHTFDHRVRQLEELWS